MISHTLQGKVERRRKGFERQTGEDRDGAALRFLFPLLLLFFLSFLLCFLLLLLFFVAVVVVVVVFLLSFLVSPNHTLDVRVFVSHAVATILSVR